MTSNFLEKYYEEQFSIGYFTSVFIFVVLITVLVDAPHDLFHLIQYFSRNFKQDLQSF